MTGERRDHAAYSAPSEALSTLTATIGIPMRFLWNGRGRHHEIQKYEELVPKNVELAYEKYGQAEQPRVVLVVHANMFLVLIKESKAIDVKPESSSMDQMQLTHAALGLLSSYVGECGDSKLHHDLLRRLTRLRDYVPNALEIMRLIWADCQSRQYEAPIRSDEAVEILGGQLGEIISSCEKRDALKAVLDLTDLPESKALSWSTLIHRLLRSGKAGHVGFAILLADKLRSRGVAINPKLERIFFRYRVQKYLKSDNRAEVKDVNDLIRSLQKLKEHDAALKFNVTRDSLNVFLLSLWRARPGLDSQDIHSVYKEVYPEWAGMGNTDISVQSLRLAQPGEVLHPRQERTLKLFASAFQARGDWTSARDMLDRLERLKEAISTGDPSQLRALNQDVCRVSPELNRESKREPEPGPEPDVA